jgi:hypothetical protein
MRSVSLYKEEMHVLLLVVFLFLNMKIEWHQLIMIAFFLDRTLVFILSIGGAICSGLASFSCEFYHFESVDNRPWPGLEPPYKSTIGADIGLFSYQITDSIEPADVREGCVAFDGRFRDFSEGNALWEAAQWCAVFAFVTGGLASYVNLCETICCSFCCSFIFACTLLFLAGGLQACTFMVLGGADFW